MSQNSAEFVEEVEKKIEALEPDDDLRKEIQVYIKAYRDTCPGTPSRLAAFERVRELSRGLAY